MRSHRSWPQPGCRADHQVRTLVDRAAAGEAKTVLAKEFGISRETVYAYLRAAHA
jgi:uncharacterized protein (DUF433 family)